MAKKGKPRISVNNSTRLSQNPITFVRSLKNEPNLLKKKTLLIGFIFEKLAKLGVDCYLVGGEAVELYTGGQFTTGDIDVTVTDRSKMETLLEQMGFDKQGMIWLNENLGIAIQIVAPYPSRTEKARLIEIEGLRLKVVGVEDLIIDRIVSAKYWRSNTKMDLEQAAVLFRNFRDSLDVLYLRKRSSEENVEDYLQEISKLNSKSSISAS